MRSPSKPEGPGHYFSPSAALAGSGERAVGSGHCQGQDESTVLPPRDALNSPHSAQLTLIPFCRLVSPSLSPPGPNCGTVALFQTQGAAVRSPRHPEAYGGGADCRWVIHAPQGHIIKVSWVARPGPPAWGGGDGGTTANDSLDVLYDVHYVYESILNISFRHAKVFIFYHRNMSGER